MRRIVLALGALSLSLPVVGCTERREPQGEPAPVESQQQADQELQALMEQTRSKLIEIEQKLNEVSQQVQNQPMLDSQIRQLRQDKLSAEQQLSELRGAQGGEIDTQALMTLQRDIGALEGKLELLSSGACTSAQPTEPTPSEPTPSEPTPPAQPTPPTGQEPVPPTVEPIPPAAEPTPAPSEPMGEEPPSIIVPVPSTPLPDEGQPGADEPTPAPSSGLEPSPDEPSSPGM